MAGRIERAKIVAEIGKLLAETFEIFRKKSTDDDKERRIKELEKQVVELKEQLKKVLTRSGGREGDDTSAREDKRDL